MSTLQEFDLQSRGIVRLVECWRAEHAAVRGVWKIEGLIDEWLRLAASATELFAHYCEHDRFPHSDATLSYFVDLVVQVVQCETQLEDVVSMFESEGHHFIRGDELRRAGARLQAIVDEERFATDAALGGGALDDWE